jgi:hypothetical protein
MKMQRLGHRTIKNPLLCVQLKEALFQGENEYISKVAKTEKEVCSLIEEGVEYITEFEGSRIFRKNANSNVRKARNISTMGPPYVLLIKVRRGGI